MDTSTTTSALDALRTAEFRLSLRGYDVDEVDDFLERAAVEADQLREQVRQASAQVAQAGERVRVLEAERGPAQTPAATATPAPEAPQKAPLPGGATPTVTKMIEMAERFVEQARHDAKTEAARVVAEAQERARQLASDAQQRLADEVARLEGMRQRLGEDVERMSNQLETERSRLTGSLHDLLGWIEKNIQPAASLAALRSPATVGATNGQTVGAGAAQVLSMDEARREE